MNKVILAEKLADELGFKKKEAFKIVELMIKYMEEALVKGEKVQLIPFGTFEVKTRRGRVGRNPKTGATIQIKERKVVAFRSGKELKQTLKGS